MQEYKDHTGCMNNVIYVLRLICVFLKGKGFQKVPEDLLPFSLPTSRKKVYPAFNTDDMKNILSQPDKSTPSGKRDYAVLILASLTEMRAIDIANLKLADIHWKEMKIHFIQHKTGNGIFRISWKLAPMKKGLYSMGTLKTIMLRSNKRFINFISDIGASCRNKFFYEFYRKK